LEADAEFVITSRDIEGNAREVSTNFKEIPKLVAKGDKILLDDGAIEFVVEKVTKTDVTTTVVNGGLSPSAKASICRTRNCRFRV
jgi:pyruvate kinase